MTLWAVCIKSCSWSLYFRALYIKISLFFFPDKFMICFCPLAAVVFSPFSNIRIGIIHITPIKYDMQRCGIYVRWCETFCWRCLSHRRLIRARCLISASLFQGGDGSRGQFSADRTRAERCCASSAAEKHAVLPLTVKPPTNLCLL